MDSVHPSTSLAQATSYSISPLYTRTRIVGIMNIVDIVDIVGIVGIVDIVDIAWFSAVPLERAKL